MKYLTTLKFPDYITILNGVAGLGAVLFMTDGSTRLGVYLILLAVLLDLIDGKVARLTNIKSEFGKDLDSLSDIVSFGVAPAVLFFLTMSPTFINLLICLLWFVAGLTRLARFNVLNVSTHYLGTPITLSAFVVSLLYLLLGSGWVLGFSFILFSLLMVSDLKIRKFV